MFTVLLVLLSLWAGLMLAAITGEPKLGLLMVPVFFLILFNLNRTLLKEMRTPQETDEHSDRRSSP